MSDLKILQEIYGDLKYWTVEELDLQFRLIALARKESKKEWVGLTDEEKHSAVWTGGEFGDGVLWAEKLLKERNT